MFGIIDITSYIIGVILVIILPGPNSLYCLSSSVVDGKKAGVYAMLGILLGDSLLMLASALGAGALFQFYPNVFQTIKLIGSLYLAYLGFKLWQASYIRYKNRHKHQAIVFKSKNNSSQNHFYRSVALSLTNPKAILFFLSFFVQFVDVNYPHPWLSFLILACILQLVSFIYLTFLIFSGEFLSTKSQKSPWFGIIAMFLTGVLFIGFAVNLWLVKFQ